MIECKDGKVTISGEWQNVLAEYMCLTQEIMQYSRKDKAGGLNPTISNLLSMTLIEGRTEGNNTYNNKN